MAFEIYGNLDLHLGQLENAKFEQVTTLPTASASNYGNIVHLVPDDIIYQCQKQGDNYVWRSLQIKKVSVVGEGNVVTDVSYDNTTDTITITKGISAVEQETGKGLSTNDYTTTEKNKLAGIAAGAEVNQKAYANVKVGATTIAAGSKTDTIELVAGSNNVTITPDATNKKVTISVEHTDLSGYIPTSQKGANNGVATLDAQGKVPSSQLPSYVDDVIEGYYYNGKFYREAAHTTEITAEAGKIYVDLSTDKTYRWGGSAYAVISETLALGETAGTAYEGSKGKALADTVAATSAQNPTLAWGTQTTLGRANGKTFKLTMPANPNTDTHVTAVENHYTPQEDTNAQINATSGSYISGIKRDAAGHVTGIQENALPTDTGATSVETTGSGNAVTSASYDSTTRKMTLTKGTTFLTEHQDISGKADKTATVSNVAYDTTNKKITKTINGTTSDVVTAAKIVTDGGGITEHQSLDGYVNDIEISGSGNAVTSVSKLGNKIIYTKGSSFLTAADVADKLQGFRTNALTGSTGSVGNAVHGFTEIYSVQAYVGSSQVFLNTLNITTETVGGETKRSMIEWDAGSTSFTSSSEFKLVIIGK